MTHRRETIRHQAIEWMSSNPTVVQMFEAYARQLVARNRRFGINLLRERVRWECVYEYDQEDYKFCNDFSPYVARYLLGKYPQWASLMRCKKTKDEGRDIKVIYPEEVFPPTLGEFEERY